MVKRMGRSLCLDCTWDLGLRTPRGIKTCTRILEICRDPRMVSALVCSLRLGSGGNPRGRLEPAAINEDAGGGQSRQPVKQ
jgi:hypothetical protein